jgi:hypothetical protein
MRALLATAGVAATFAAAPAVAQQAQAAQYACFVPGSGTIYRIKEPKTPTQCGSGHVEFQMSAGTKPSSGPTGPAGGDLGGTYPNPSVVKLQGQPLLNASGAFDFSNLNGIVSVGTIGSGALPISGPGTRFMWYPAKRALRAGYADNEWDDANIGDASMALGLRPKASGFGSIALGINTISSNIGSVAFGAEAAAIGQYSTAIGMKTVANGFGAVAIGSGSTAVGTGATALGQGVHATIPSATALGGSSSATAFAAIVIGNSLLASAERSMALGNYASTNGMQGAFVYGDNSSTSPVAAAAPNQFAVRAQNYWFGTGNTTLATAGRLIETSTGAYLTTGGAWTNSSDVDRKHAFERVDTDSVLDKIAAMPVQTWSYKTESDSVRHMGPTAQDFRKAFGLGDTDKAIATVDADGVSLAGIKALVQRTTELRRENQELRAALADLYRRLSELEIARR